MKSLYNPRIIDLAKQLSQRLEIANPSFEKDSLIETDKRFEGRRKIRKSGIGEEFFQFRPLEANESAGLIDWRASAKSDILQVKEREIHAKDILYIWLDLRPSMFFVSDKRFLSKAHVGMIVVLAITEIARKNQIEVRAFSKSSRDFIEALFFAGQEPPGFYTKSESLIISDCMYETQELFKDFENFRQTKANKTLGVINDISEINFDLSGKINFINQQKNKKVLIEDCEAIQQEYKIELEKHFAEIQQFATENSIEVFRIGNHQDYFSFAQSILNSLFRF